MAPAFSKEAVLQGSIDHLCLVCESYLRSEREVCAHVSTPEHAQNLKSTDYLEKYRNDRVRKVKKWYFCEFCNLLLSTMTKVRLHVEEPRHQDNIASQTIDRVDDDVIVSGNVAISEEAWHGLIDDNTCAICNVEFEDKLVHMAESTHIINLIQSKVKNDFKNIYRKTDDSTFHCLTCNTVVPAITPHLDDTDHITRLQKCIPITPILVEGSKKEKLVEECLPECINETSVIDKEKGISNENHRESNRSDVSKDNRTITKGNVDVKTDECVKDTETKDYITCDQTDDEKPEEKSKETTQKGHDAILKIAEEHDLTRTGNKVYCKICKKYIPFSVRNINEHVNGESHRVNAKLYSKSIQNNSKENENNKINTKKINIQRVSIQHFIRIITTVKNMFAEDVVINEKYCINIMAFTFFTMISPGRLRCQVCEIDMNIQNMRDHSENKRHDRALHEVPVIIHMDSEFIREIRSEIFQCGFCNTTHSWEGLENHLKSTSHKESKTFANWRLSQHLPQIEQHRMERQVHNEFLMRLMFA